MGLYEEYKSYKYDMDTIIENEDSYDKAVEIMNSDLSILKMWIGLYGHDITIKPRANNIYYCKCHLHNDDVLAVCLDENKKAFFCYGCCKGVTIIDLIAKEFNISLDESIKILYTYISNDISVLNKKELEISHHIFKNYNSSEAEKYYKISEDKTNRLNNRIENYKKQYGDSPKIERKMCKRLCCSKKHIHKEYYL